MSMRRRMTSKHHQYDRAMRNDEVQLAKRDLADAEEALRQDPTEANQRRAMNAWLFARRTRESAQQHDFPPREDPEPPEAD
jgi:hypothetical protein